MMQKLRFALGFLCLVLTSNFALAQAGDYSLTVSSGTFTPLGSSAINTPDVEADSDTEIVPIGFSFIFDGAAYDTVVASSNGFISFNQSAGSNTTNDLDGVGATSRPLAAPLWDDSDGRAPNGASKASYETTGTAPNRVFTFEWLNWEWDWGASDSTASFQVKLYEGSNVVEFTYDNNGKPSNSADASIGLTGVSTFLSLSGFGTGTIATSNTTETSNIDTIVTGQILTFTPPLCPAPTFTSFTNVTTDSITINFSGNGSGPWYVNWGPQGFTQGSPTSNYDTATTATSITVGGLMSGTSYDFYIREDCGVTNGQSNWAGPYVGTTIFTPPYMQAFNTGYPPNNDFTEAQGLINNPTVFSNTASSSWVEDGFTNVGNTGSARINIWSTTRDAWFFGPSIDLGDGSITYQIEFDAGLTPFGGTGTATLGVDDTVKVVISTDNGLTWNDSNTVIVLTDATPIANGSGTHFVGTLAGYTGVIKFGFYAESTVSNEDNDFFVDNVQIRVPPLCPVVTLVNTVTVASDSVVVNWVSSETAFTIEYGVSPYTQGGGGTTIAVTDTFVVINGLNANTAYDIYIQTDCSGSSNGTSPFVGPQTIRTLCTAFTAPYLEDFEASTASCWSNEYVSGSADWTITTGANGGTVTTANSGTLNAAFTSSGSGDETRFVSPQIDVTALANVELSFWYAQEDWAGDQNYLNVYYRTGPSSPWVWVWADSNNVTAWTKGIVTIPASSATLQVAFQGIDLFGRANVVDDVNIDAVACPTPSFTSFTDVNSFGAVINWSSFSGFSNFEWGPAGFIQGTGTGTVVRNADPSDTLIGLTPNTCYDVYIQDTCNGTATSSWIGPFQFCTPVTCPAPTNLGIDPTQLTVADAALIWTPGGSASHFVVEYGLVGFTQGTGTQVVSTNDTLNISSLSAGTEYEFYVQDSCGLGDVSFWSGPFSFVTAFTTNYLDDFNAGGNPFAWLEADGRLTSNTQFTAGTSSWGSDNFANVGGGQLAQRVNIFFGGQYEWLITPSIYLDPTITNLQVEFDAAITDFANNAQGYFGSDDSLAIVISTDNGNTWSSSNMIWSATANDTIDFAGEHYVLPLTGYSGYVRFGIYAGSTIDDTEDTDWFIDNFEVRTPRACTSPTSIVVDQIATDSALVSWTAGDVSAIDWSVIYTTGNQPASAGTVINSTNDSIFLTGLNPSSDYCIYIVEQCANGFSDTVGPECFTTLCIPFVAPYYDDMDANGWVADDIDFSAANSEIGNCWTGLPEGTAYNWRVRSIGTGSGSTGPDSDSTGGSYVYTEASSGSAGDTADLISPWIDMSALTDPLLTFAYHFYGADIDRMYVSVYDGVTWTNMDTISGSPQASSAAAWEIDSIDLNGFLNQMIQVRFRAISGGCCSGDMALDAFRIDELGVTPCLAPTSLAAANANCDSIQLSWTSDAASTYSTIEYELSGFTQGTGIIVSGVTSPYTINGLALDTDYDFYVIDSCGSSVSPSAGPFTFKSDSIGPLLASFTSIQVSTTLTNADVDFDASASTNAVSYSWDFGNTNTGAGATATETFDTNGVYDVTLTITDKCGNTDDTIVTITVGGISIVENTYNATIDMYPNPTSGVFKVNVSNGNSDYKIEVVDVSGKVIFRNEGLRSQEEQTIDLGAKATGVYTVRIIGEGLNVSRRLMIK